MSGGSDHGRVRLSELVAALSLGIDLGFGQPMEHVLRQCLIALALAERAGLDENERAAVYYTALLINIGCHSDAYEQANWFGDDIALKSGWFDHPPRSLRRAAAIFRLVGSGSPPIDRVRAGLEFAVSGRRAMDALMNRHAQMARAFADDLPLPAGTPEALSSSYEQWDGHGWPGVLNGDAVPIAARVVQIAEFVEVAHRIGGEGAATDLARRQSGKQFDPRLVAILIEAAGPIFSSLDSAGTWSTVIESEPALVVRLNREQFDETLVAIANFVSLKSPYTLGHSVAVAELAAAAASLTLGPDQTRLAHRAGLVLDLGRLGVPNSIWDKPGPLGPGEWERVKMSPYLTERMLRQSDALRPLGELAVQHRERLDGSGYPRGVSGVAISRPARILGTADAYQSMLEARPYRAARSADEAAGELRAEVKAGRLDGDAVDAVLTAAGHRVRVRRESLGGLTTREVDVLRLLAQGLSNKQIAERLVISPKTVGNHIEHIYSKINASNRASASLFAVKYGLLPADQFAAA